MMAKNYWRMKKSSTKSDPITELKKAVNGIAKNSDLLLDDVKMKQIKQLCKSCPDNIPRLYHFLMIQLRKDNAKVRYNILLAINDFFLRSHAFRKLLENDLEEFLQLTVETEIRKPLPPPKSVAEKLKCKTLCFIKEWHRQFGSSYSMVKNAYSFLLSCKNLTDLEPEDISSSSPNTECAGPDTSGITEVFRMKKEMEEHSEEIFSIITQMEKCFQMLFPLPDDLFSESDLSIPDSPSIEKLVTQHSGSTDFEDQNSLRQHGIFNMNTVVSIEINKVSDFTVEVNDNTTPILESLKTMRSNIINVYLPMIGNWLAAFNKESGVSSLIKKVTDMKEQLESKLVKYDKLRENVKSTILDEKEEDTPLSEDSDSDFEEVLDKEGYEATVPEFENDVQDSDALPTCSKSYSASDSNNKSQVGVVNFNLPSTSKSLSSDWQDPVLLKELEATTGVNLKMPERVKTNTDEIKHDKLMKLVKSDRKKPSESTHSRLQKKLHKLKRKNKK